MIQPTLPKGTRDFDPDTMQKRKFLIDTISRIFEKFAYQPLETPAIENLSILEGKSGGESDKLMFRILNSGEYLNVFADKDQLINTFNHGIKEFTSKITEKALRYDLTIPLARFVSMNRNSIIFPFKRYQIQPVWRADRPQKGRYREFYQCDIDTIGSDSVFYDAELVMIMDEVLNTLKLKPFIIKINNRKILNGISQFLGIEKLFEKLCICIDKIEKIGMEGTFQEFRNIGISEEKTEILKEIFFRFGRNSEKIAFLKQKVNQVQVLTGLEELEKLMNYSKSYGVPEEVIEVDFSLARGLSYYTSSIFEAKFIGSDPSLIYHPSICGGGRYDNLTDLFGLNGVSGTGVSFGFERIFDLMDDLKLFPDLAKKNISSIIICLDEKLSPFSLNISQQVREAGFCCDMLPPGMKLKKQLSFANSKKYSFSILIGEEEGKNQILTLKNMNTGVQQKLSLSQIIDLFINETKSI